ncbi:MAG: family 78 glycoside hydrolase catalytic domain [Bacteroidetes bacterium]|nr:family 78 glycoside hydrolase catalytic domain [Bacteroidota bacterium]
MSTRSPLLALVSALLVSVVTPAFTIETPPRVGVGKLTTEYKVDPVGIDVMQPRFGWQLQATERGVLQSAYEIQVAQSERQLVRGRDLLWETGKIDSDQSIHVEYAGPTPVSGQRYFWRVRVWDQAGNRSDWSKPAYWEMGLLNESDWTAEWITPLVAEDSTAPPPVPLLRGTFDVDGRVQSARLYVTSLGLNEVFLNGSQVGDRVLTPGWTSYNTRLQYETYDVTDLVRSGANVLGAMVAEGWFRGRLAWRDQHNIYGDKFGLLAQLNVTFADGSTRTYGTNKEWKAASGPVVSSGIYDGEVYDARLERDGWDDTGYDDSNWNGVAILDHAKDILIAPAGPPMRRIEELKPVSIFTTPAGDTVVDLGQNMVGWVWLRVIGPAWTTVKRRHAEVLDSDGNFYTENLRAAKAAATYTLRGSGEEVYEPHFTFMGFRYVAVEGYPGELTSDNITGVVVHSDMEPTGTFETSNEMLNKLQHNIVWGQRGNFLDVPTDTPARDERLGWTGDAQAFAPTAAFNYNVASFFTKWLADVATDQKPNGSVPWVVPDVLAALGGSAAEGGAAGWGDIATIGPWTMYLAYGDERLLATQYPSMKNWVDFIHKAAGDDLIWSETFTFGDWLSFATTNADYPGATTDKDMIATMFFAHSADLTARAATVLGEHEDATFYRSLFNQIKDAFNREYVTGTGRIASNTQTAYALALEFNLLPETMRNEAGERLAADVSKFGHLTTGFLGTPHLAPALQHTGHIDLAYQLLLREKYPSWLYPITRGATTMWERWDGIKEDGSFQDVGMNSFNHYAYGAIGDWMYRVVAGLQLDPTHPAYKHVLIQPHPGGDLAFAHAEIESLYGRVSSKWERTTSGLRVAARVAANTTATVRLPGAVLATVTESGRAVRSAPGVSSARQDGDDVVVETGSGNYVFEYPSAK